MIDTGVEQVLNGNWTVPQRLTLPGDTKVVTIKVMAWSRMVRGNVPT